MRDKNSGLLLEPFSFVWISDTLKETHSGKQPVEDQVFEISVYNQKASHGRSFTVKELRFKLGRKFYGPELYVLRINGREYGLPNSKGKHEMGLTFVTIEELIEHIEYCFELDKSFYE